MTRTSLRRSLMLVLAATALAGPAQGAVTTVDQQRPADPRGQVEIDDVAGRIEVLGWDKPEVAVSGTMDAERLELTGDGPRTVVRVVEHKHLGVTFGWNNAETRLTVHVPRQSSLMATLVSADLRVRDLLGDQEVHTTSGDVDLAAARELRVQTVSGDLRLTLGADVRLVDLESTSGDVHLAGNGGGDVAIKTVSGDGELSFGAVSKLRLSTVSGDFGVHLALAADGRVEAQSVSGDFVIDFTNGMPPLDAELRTLSGDLTSCLGHTVSHDGHGPGAGLTLHEGAGSARLRVNTMSGDVRLCARK